MASTPRSFSRFISANNHARNTISCSSRSSGCESPFDGSLEDEADLSFKIRDLQDQVSALNQSQDDQYIRVKQENSSLLSKIDMLEEQMLDMEVQNEKRQKEEEKRFEETISRILREKSFECDQFMAKIFTLQQDLLESQGENNKNQSMIQNLKEERRSLEEMMSLKTEETDSLKDEIKRLKEINKKAKNEIQDNHNLILLLNQELMDLKKFRSGSNGSINFNGHHHNSLSSTSGSRSSSISESSKLTELESMNQSLKNENRSLKDQNEELQAQLMNQRVEEGRCLLVEGEKTMASLADELVTLSEEQVSSEILMDDDEPLNLNLSNLTNRSFKSNHQVLTPFLFINDDYEQMRKALKEQQEVNSKLRSYIDGILLNIVENYPQLLEVKSPVLPTPSK